MADQHLNGHSMTGLPRAVPGVVAPAGDLLLERQGAELAAGVAVAADPVVAATLLVVAEALVDAPATTTAATEAALVEYEVNGQGLATDGALVDVQVETGVPENLRPLRMTRTVTGTAMRAARAGSHPRLHGVGRTGADRVAVVMAGALEAEVAVVAEPCSGNVFRIGGDVMGLSS